MGEVKRRNREKVYDRWGEQEAEEEEVKEKQTQVYMREVDGMVGTISISRLALSFTLIAVGSLGTPWDYITRVDSAEGWLKEKQGGPKV